MTSDPIDPDGELTDEEIREEVTRRTGGKQWTNHFTPGTPLHDLYDRRVRGDQDIVVIWDDYHQRRGTGKTTGCIQLAAGFDRTPEGFTKEKACIEPQELVEAYTEQPKGSALLMDEAEIGASNRKAMTNVNQALRKIVATGRVEEKYVILNAPSMNFIDLHLRSMATVWICTLRKGLAQVHFIENNPYENKQLTPKQNLFEWKDINPSSRLKDIYNYLTDEKKKHIRGEKAGRFVTESELNKEIEKAKETARREERNKILREIHSLARYQNRERLRLADLGEAVGLSQSQVSRIVNEE